MSDDLKLVKQLEKETGIKLKRVTMEDIEKVRITGFAADDNVRVQGLAIYKQKLLRLPALLSKFQRLEKLVLAGTQISDISSLKELKNLEQLYLFDNKITHIPSEFLDLGMEIKWRWDRECEGIYLAGNPLESPPVEIVQQGTEAVRQYFKSFSGDESGDEQDLNEVKVLLVGDGAAGKTSLVKRLLGKRFNKNESQTHGININTMEITQNNSSIKTRLWDFGGQEIMHATHQFFLSKRSLYILVLDGRKDEKTEYWLNHIKSFGGDSPVLVVLNKIDQNPGFDVNSRHLMVKYPHIKGFYRLSCKSGNGIDPFKKELTQQLAAIEMLRTTWATSWFNVKKHLEEMDAHFITYETYGQICQTAGVKSEKERDTLVDFLNDLGVILHFKEFHLEDTHVLEPKWITNAVYKIINSELLSSGKGVLELGRLGEILKAEKSKNAAYTYPPDKYKYIFQLMNKFELCFAMDKNKILVPDLLEKGEPVFDFDYTRALKFRISYDFLPQSVMPRFIVRNHMDIKDKLNWRTGVVLANKGFNAVAVVKADHREKLIHIYVDGVRKRDYFAVLLNTFREINGSFEQIEWDEGVPLPDNPAIAVNYHHLLRLERRGQQEFLPEKADKDYNVKELLDGIRPEKERQLEAEQLIRDGKLEIYVQQNVSQTQQVHTEVNVNVNISVDLPAVRDDFSELKELLESKHPALSGKLKEIMDSLDEVTPQSSKEKLSKPMNKLGRFLKKLGNEDSDANKMLNGIGKGLDTARKVAKTYNKFAQWIPGLPVVPDALLKE
ncbi:MAG: GTP-binding protein [bacterium]|nr:GTP-binding protein [bacterium]